MTEKEKMIAGMIYDANYRKNKNVIINPSENRNKFL